MNTGNPYFSDNFQIDVRGYKSLRESVQSIQKLRPINLIVGRNNSGKSALLDVVQYLAGSLKIPEFAFNDGKAPEIGFVDVISTEGLKRVFRPEASGGPIPGSHWNQFGINKIGTKVGIWIDDKGKKTFRFTEPDMRLPNRHDEEFPSYAHLLANNLVNPFSGKTCFRISAERQVVPEGDRETKEIEPNGAGVTNAFQRFLNKSELPSERVEKTCLEQLNEIFSPDAVFTRISVQQHKNNLWEVYLEEKEKGGIPLSLSGSGLQTVMQVIAFMNLLPILKNISLDRVVFLLEELENNIHPALQRRLTKYIRHKILANNAVAFITTHSAAIIDQLRRDDTAQIIHVRHFKGKSVLSCVQTYIENSGLLDDLDVRASDLLQANCVVWVEGPSDRLYLSRWIDVWTEGRIKEGTDYQCVFYGGRLMKHLSAAVEDGRNLVNEGIRILTVNRNVALVFDSDKRSKSAHINQTKKRIEREVTDASGIVWMTHGREIEHYLPANAICRAFGGRPASNKNMFLKYSECLKPNSLALKEYEDSKAEFAAKIVPFLTKDDIDANEALRKQIVRLCAAIDRWNGRSE